MHNLTYFHVCFLTGVYLVNLYHNLKHFLELWKCAPVKSAYLLVLNHNKLSTDLWKEHWIELTFCSFHRIEQNICLVGTSINEGCAVYYYSVMLRLRIRSIAIANEVSCKISSKAALQTWATHKILYRFEQEILPFGFARRHCYGVYCTVSNHSKFSPNKKEKVWCHVCWTAGTSAMTRSKG